MENLTHQELPERDKAKSSTDLIFWMALSGIGLSAVLQILRKNPQHPLIDICAAPFVLWMVCLKLKKEQGRQSGSK